MTISNLNIPEERINLFSFLRNCTRYCVSDHPQHNKAFEILYQTWENTSVDLWFLGYWNDYFRCAQVVLEASRALNQVRVEAQVLAELGWTLLERDRWVESDYYCQESLKKYQLISDIRGQCRLFRYLGVLAHRQDNLELALGYYHKALDIVNSVMPIHDAKWVFNKAELLNLIGCTYLNLKNFANSYEQLNLSLKTYEMLLSNYPDDQEYYRYYSIIPLMNLGQWYFLQGDFEQARQSYYESLKMSQIIHRPDTEAGALLRLAVMAEAEGNNDEALKLASQAEEIAGTDAPAVRNQAAHLKENLVSKLALT